MAESPPTPGPDRTVSPDHLLRALSLLIGLGVCLMMALVGGGLILNVGGEQGAVPPARTALAWTAVAVAPTVSPTAALTSTTPSPALVSPFAETAAPTPEASSEHEAASGAPGTDEPVPPESSACVPPEGWELHHVLPGETLFAYVLGAGGTVTTDDLRRANCLSGDLLQIGQPLYLPPGAAENAPSSEPVAPTGTGPRIARCDPHCTISIRPGWRAEQIAVAVDGVGVGFWGSDFMTAIGPAGDVPAYDFLASRPPGNSLEGYLYPGTYELGSEDSAADFRDMLLAAFAAHIPAEAEASAAAHSLTFYQALILASIIQREAWAASEQNLISSVFHNRLRVGSPLGATVTMQYALGGPGDWWPRISGSQINLASSYNTNLNAGLPPAPISNPGVEAITAALRPADTSYLYFTGNCRGSGNLYAATYEEHLANVESCR